MNSWVFGAVCDDLAAACVPEQAGSSRLHAVFTSPPPTLHLAGDIDEWTFPDLTSILARVAAAGAPRVHVDLADVEYCDVAGLRPSSPWPVAGEITGPPSMKSCSPSCRDRCSGCCAFSAGTPPPG